MQRGFGEHRNRQHKREKEKKKLQEKDDTRFPLASVYAQDKKTTGTGVKIGRRRIESVFIRTVVINRCWGILFF